MKTSRGKAYRENILKPAEPQRAAFFIYWLEAGWAIHGGEIPTRLKGTSFLLPTTRTFVVQYENNIGNMMFKPLHKTKDNEQTTHPPSGKPVGARYR
jgi:hypothetical protein